MEQNNSIVFFQEKTIRKVWHDENWFFSVIDIIEVLTENPNPSRYWQDLKRKSSKTDGQLYDFVVKLKLAGKDNKNYPTDCATTEGIFRIIMSIPSPKAEPFKLWLAEQGSRTIDEINDPELLMERQAEYYKLKGYSDEWIAHRMKNIEVRKGLTDEWQKRGVDKSREYSILTATISKGTFGITPSEHSQIKGLDKENLRDHMTTLELLLTSLGEEVTRAITVNSDSKGFMENHEAAIKGGEAGRIALKGVEEKTGQKVVSSSNFKHLNLKDGENQEPSQELPDAPKS